jgi:hypothetical protein
MNNSTDTQPPRKLVLVHGRGYKPSAGFLKQIWTDSLTAGLKRDYPDALAAFTDVDISIVHYGDLLATWMERAGQSVDPDLDKKDREKALAEMASFDRAKRFRRVNYDQLPGKSSFGEFIADISMPLAHSLGAGEKAMRKLLPELLAYWQDTDGFGSTLDQRMIGALTQAFAGGGSTMVIAHCMGSVAAYNSMWTLSRELGMAAKVDRFVTLGSPLADETVKKRLKGSDLKGPERFPANIVHWTNLSAEDDYVCHDETVANDYQAMVDEQIVSRIEDVHIYNLAVRFGKSNPHSSLGYLIHPRMATVMNDWLNDS